MEAFLQKLEPKDILTFTLSSFSLVIAGIAFLYTVFSKRRELAISVEMICTTAFLSCPKIKFNLRVYAESLEGISARFSIRENETRLLSSDSFSSREQYI